MKKFFKHARAALLAERNDQGHWEGELSSSPLSTATAVIALHFVDSEDNRDLICGGIRWLVVNQNTDGGWGDTAISFSNISTTLLVWSALSLGPDEPVAVAVEAVEAAERWIKNHVGSLDPDAIKAKVVARYGKDKTFSVPILMTCALCGRLGSTPREGWKRVLPLPFELAAFPRKWYAALRLPVVSYALPALIAIGYARHFHAKPFVLFRPLRRLTWSKVSRLLAEIQPTSGGYLEATPLTSFVTMALAGADQKHHSVVPRAVAFLHESVREDGSWPIDTNLATWGTTLAIKALTVSNKAPKDFPAKDRQAVLEWLLEQQYRTVHPFTVSPPGAWAWTDLSGGVPDADDTPGALIAVHRLVDHPDDPAIIEAAAAGVTWLLDLQNRDGGIPTFCRGWGALPFDRSSPDLTAHTLRAWRIWKPHLSKPVQARTEQAEDRALRYLATTQATDGSWTPLWFGNQHLETENNQTYGTAKVVLALAEVEEDLVDSMRRRGVDWLLQSQSENGGWSGGDPIKPVSIEETSLAISALCAAEPERSLAAIERGVRLLKKMTDGGRSFPAAPIGFYFAKLWYWERLYPMVWCVEALGRVKALRTEKNS